MVTATGIGSMPGGDARGSEADNSRDYEEAVRVVVGELTDMLPIPELPGRGAVADMTGRALAIVEELGADLQPFGWRLTAATGMDQRRARSLLAQDLDRVEEHTQGFTGVLKTQVAGPWTLAATVEKPRGDKVLADHGARRDLADALAEGLVSHLADLRRRVPAVREIVVQIDEPALPAVLGARIPTTSGWGKHRAIDQAEASAHLETACAAITAAGCTPIVHCCAPGFPIGLVRRAGARGIAVDLDQLDAGDYDDLAAALEAGDRVLLGAIPTDTSPTTPQVAARFTERILRLLEMLGLEPTANLVVTPACGLAAMTPTEAVSTLRLTREVASHLR